MCVYVLFDEMRDVGMFLDFVLRSWLDVFAIWRSLCEVNWEGEVKIDGSGEVSENLIGNSRVTKIKYSN